ncbi:MAG: DUF2851 family protein [Calditrichaceae bacterium]
MQEEDIYHWWQYYGRSGKTVYSRGRRLSVESCGTLNTARGPDFISARFILDGITYQGDVECHLKSSDWYAHQHHLDKAFRHVVLHLVASPVHRSPVKSKWCAQEICTFVLPEPANNYPFPARTCKPLKAYETKLTGSLMRLSLERFEQKTRLFLKLLTVENYQALFYVNYFRALGYPANANSFQLLAERLSWSRLFANIHPERLSSRDIFAVFAGQAGFIPFKPADEYSRLAGLKYREYGHLLPGVPFEDSMWQIAGIRPLNHPHFRLAAGLHLLKHHNFSLFDKINQALQMRRQFSVVMPAIMNIFNISPEPYWSDHYALGKRHKNFSARVCIGKARLTELLINVILPLAAARAVFSGSDGYYAYLQSLYLALPLVSTYGMLNRRMPWVKQCRNAMPVQAVNQALLTLQSGFCSVSLCDQCPINRTQ